jgi:hypothetical protein
MKIQEQAYGGQLFRPTPDVFCEDSGSLCLIATPWGQRASAKKVIEIVVDFFLSAHSDRESTSPFEKDLNLSPTANNLKAAVQLANETVFQELNLDEYKSGCELFVGAKIDEEFSFIQVGQPQVYLARPGLPLLAMASGLELSTMMSPEGQQLPPLPRQILGIEKTSNLHIQTYSIRPTDSIVLLSRSLCPPRFLSHDGGNCNLEELANSLITQDEMMPFWLGLLK